jgi:hypothetical protein
MKKKFKDHWIFTEPNWPFGNTFNAVIGIVVIPALLTLIICLLI